jgi:hypothetical protein
MTISSSAPVAVFFLFVGMSAASLQAQSVTGRVIDHTTGVGVPSAAIAVVDRTGARVGVAYSDSLGRFLVALDAGGTLRVEVGQLGYLPAIGAAPQLSKAAGGSPSSSTELRWRLRKRASDSWLPTR